MKKVFYAIISTLLVVDCYAQFPTFDSIDINPGPVGTYPSNFDTLNGKVVFIAGFPTIGSDQLFITDGTQSGTSLIKDIYPGTKTSWMGDKGALSANGKYFFTVNDSIHGYELWASDGTTPGTQIVKDINPGLDSSLKAYCYLTSMNGKIYFAANDGINGNELWVTDGTSSGTKMVKDINSGSNSSNPKSITMLNGKLYFSANDGINGDELWVSDGTSNGTQLVKDINPGSSGSLSFNSTLSYCIYYSNLVFVAYTATDGYEMWLSDGTTSGTHIIKDINPGIKNGAYPFVTIAIANGKMFFPANDSISGVELWASDGTNTGTQMVKDICAGSTGSIDVNTFKWAFSVLDNKIIFSANDSIHGYEPWISDGTSSGTSLIKDIYPGFPDSGPSNYITCRNKIFFSARIVGNGSFFWSTDGKFANTNIIQPITTTSSNPLPIGLIRGWFVNPYDSSFYFGAHFTNIGFELWMIKDSIKKGTSGNVTSIANNSTFTLYPNPNNGTFTLQLDNNNFTTGSLQVYDALGRRVHEQAVTDKTQTIRLQQPAGNYWVKLQLDDAVLTKQVMLE